MKYEFFKNVTSKEELYSQYKKLAMEHHPDHGGRVEEMQKINAEYNELKTQAENLDPVELFYARESLRNECEEAAESRIHSASKGNDFWGMASARQTVDGELDLYAEEQRVNRILWERKQGEREQPQQKKPKDRDQER